MKRTSIAVVAVLGLMLVACGAEKVDEAPNTEPVAKADEAVKPAEPAPVPGPAKPVEEAAKMAEPAPAAAPPAAEPQIPETIQLLIEGAKKGAVAFPHKLHVGLPIVSGKCNTCHHTADETGAGAQKCGAAGCHDGTGKVAPKDAFHDTCRGCHTKALAAQPENAKLKGLKSCKACHTS